MNQVRRRLLMVVALVVLPCSLMSQSKAQVSRKCSAIRADEHELEYELT
jgi:hypothetical protein